MKIALVHDYIKEYGGAERVLEALHELYPDAPVFTTVYLPQFLGPHKGRFKSWTIKTSWLQFIPMKGKLISPFRILSPFVFKSFDFSKHDVIIVSATGAYFPNSLTKGKAIQVCYCHTPPRYLYGYKTAREWKKNGVVRIFAAITNHFLRIVDFRAAERVDHFIANSEEVKGRIQKFYRKDAVVIYPPVDLSPSSPRKRGSGWILDQVENDKKEYYLAGGRLARPKHIDLIVRACRELRVPLKVFGKGFAGYGEELKEMAGPTVEFLGEVSDEEKMDLMARARAFIFAAEDEDFGIVPVEAMAAGTPVIAYRSGGVKETVVDGKTGLFFDELSVESLKKTIKRFNDLNHQSMREACVKQAQKFSKERFKKEISDFVKSKVKS